MKPQGPLQKGGKRAAGDMTREAEVGVTQS